jgi:hypothetical protein
MNATLNHGGVAVTISPAGKFEATVGGVKLTAPSFDSLKKKIEKAGAFEPFEAFHVESWRDEVTKFQVTGIRKAPKSNNGWGEKFLYVTKEGHGGHKIDTRARVYRATPENLAIANELIELKKANQRAYEAGKKAERELEAKLTVSKADADMTAQELKARGDLPPDTEGVQS